MEYNFREIEKKWQAYWANHKTFKTDNASEKPKYYVLDMFPYPSGAGLHVGHPLGYIASDIFARYKRLKGFNVLHPMGYDSFGLPAEQYAIQTGQHPEITTRTNIARYREQLDKMGFSFDWDREVRTSDPAYYKWTQWIFIQLFNSWYNTETDKAEPIETLIEKFKSKTLVFLDGKSNWEELSEKQQSDILLEHRLAFLSDTMVNWCPQLGTVLANEEVKDGVSERGGYPVERKLMRQWSLRISAYANRLLNDLDALDWTESIKEAQRNWIGRSEGTSLKFDIDQFPGEQIEVFTTRPDTVFGVSFVTLAPEHELVQKITSDAQRKEVENYILFAKNRSERERMADVKKITGAFTGSYVIHPFTQKPLPIWIGDYVLAGYGTGAVMAVPGHDTRDYAFAKHFHLPIIEVVSGGDLSKESYDAKEGKLIHSDFLNGLEVKEAIKKAVAVIEERGLGVGKTNFRLRDAIFGRQRYWGEPIPIYYKDDIPYVLPERELPLLLPEVDKYLPTETGEPPLARAKDWKYKDLYEYEYSTMPGWAGSSWYYLRYMDANDTKAFASRHFVDYWQNVDLYIGGAEHATGHLLYVRFWTKFLYDLGLIPVIEPAKKLINQGMIQGVSSIAYRMIFLVNYSNINNDLNIENFKDSPQFEKVNSFLAQNPYFISTKLFLKHKYLPGSVGFNEPIIQRRVDEIQAKLKKEIPEFQGKLIYGGEKTDIHVDVNIVDNNILNIDKFKNWLPDFKNANFLFEENGDYICGTEIEKMSKSKWNVVSPDLMVEQYGADALRLYEMFLGPLELSKPWNTNGISGVSNFIRKLWRLYHNGDALNISNDAASKAELKTLHKTIKKIASDIESFSFNTSVSNFMICVNELTELKCNKREILEPLAIIIAPYGPHLAEELWNKLGHTESITYAAFPEVKEEYLVESAFNYPVSFNGKTRFFQEYDLSLSKEAIEKEVLNLEQTQKYLEGKTPKKIIVVHNKIVNIVV
jgi:leucyl-tRNA synthetase